MAPSSLLILLHFYLQLAASIGQQPELPPLREQEQALALLDRHQAQLDRLEALIQSLSGSVVQLESSLATRARLAAPPPPLGHRPLFAEKFGFFTAGRLKSDPTCAAVLPYAGLDGVAEYVAVGDPRGVTYVLASHGKVALEIPSVSDSPVVSILGYLVPARKNESLLFLFTGHGDGSIAAHRISESNGGGWSRLVLVGSKPFVRGTRDLESPPVVLLEMHQIGRTRYIVAADSGGRIRVFTENTGTLYGTAIASSRPLSFMKQRLLFLTETGAGSLDLRSMVVKESECEGLNGSLAKSYVFDATERSKAYGVTWEGDLIHVVLLGDGGNLKCRIRSIRKSEIDAGPVMVQAVRGYLLALTQDKVYVYNISSQYYGRVGAPRPLLVSTLQEIRSMFLSADAVNNGLSLLNPLLATDRKKLVVFGLGGGYIGICQSNLPLFKPHTSAVFWSVPVLLFLLFLIGLWQFFVKKKDSLDWPAEETFNASSTSTNSLLAPGPNERAFGEVSRAGDARELRGGLRSAQRRYVSPPSGYSGGSTNPFRPASSDSAFRGTTASSDSAFRGTTASSDSVFRGATDLKYRGPTLETPPGFPSREPPPGFPSRREPLFPNTQVGDEHID